MNYNITRNEAFNSLEITFDGKPSEAVRDALKALRFRWHGVKKLWYGYTDEETARAAIEGADKIEEAAPVVKTGKPAPQDHIRIYWNGIKIDGGKLIRCYYSLNNDCTVKGDCISISARDYADLPRDLLPVHNDTDIYTDYIDSDRATLTPDHPLYKYFRFVAAKAKIRELKSDIKRMEEDISNSERWPGRHAYCRQEIDREQEQLKALESIADPGQPTAADLEAIDKRRQEAENARRAAEHEAELKEREAVLNMKNDGRRMIEAAAEANPIQEGAPVVTINWSEHPAFYQWADGELKLSISAADSILRALDLKAHNDPDHGYYKTSFQITGTDPDGEAINYEGRYDLGDCDGGLIQHIRAIGEWERTHEAFGQEKAEPDETNDRIQFADYLEQFTA